MSRIRTTRQAQQCRDRARVLIHLRATTATADRIKVGTLADVWGHGWDRADAGEWAPVPATRLNEQRVAAEALEEPEVPRVRMSRVVLAFVLILTAGVVGILGSVPGAVNGATIACAALGGAGLAVIVAEVRR